jgi:hypothetical protein
MSTDDDRIAYLAGDAVPSLSSSELAELDALRATLADEATWIEPSPSLEDGVLAAIAAEVAAAGVPAPAPARAAAAATRRRRRSLPAWFALPRYGFALAGAAAAAVVVVALAVSSGGNSGPPPLRFAMVITGTPLAPGAGGSATLTKTPSGWRVELRVSGLPHRRNGLYYEAWLKNAAGILVPIGTFNDGRNVTLWSGVPVTQFRSLTVTQQQANGDPRSSGLRVLTGTATPVK